MKRSKLSRELEDLYLYFSDAKCSPTEEGREQFHRADTFGEYPADPDPYYLCLSQGKKWFNATQKMVKATYLTEDWWGWFQYWVDWEGRRWMLRHLMAWHQKPPEWLFSEEE